MHVDWPDRCNSAHGRVGDPLGQRRQDARRRLDDRDPDVALRIDVLEAVGGVRFRRLPDLRGELDAGRARADDHDVDMAGLAGRLGRVGAHARGEQLAMEALRLGAACRCAIECCATPGTPKSLLTLPTAMTSMS